MEFFTMLGVKMWLTLCYLVWVLSSFAFMLGFRRPSWVFFLGNGAHGLVALLWAASTVFYPTSPAIVTAMSFFTMSFLGISSAVNWVRWVRRQRARRQ